MSLDIFVRTFPGDYPWLPHLWRSVDKYATGFRRVVLVHPAGSPLPPLPNCPHVVSEEAMLLPNDYHGQQATKLRAPEFTDADVVCFVDSDCVFTVDVDLAAYVEPLPTLLVTPWERAGDALGAWLGPTTTLLGFPPPFEAMRRLPLFYPRDVISETWQHIGGLNGVRACIAKHGSMSEFNAIGNYAVVKRPGAMRVVNTETGELPTAIVRQFWSHHGVDHPDVAAERERLGL